MARRKRWSGCHSPLAVQPHICVPIMLVLLQVSQIAFTANVPTFFFGGALPIQRQQYNNNNNNPHNGPQSASSHQPSQMHRTRSPNQQLVNPITTTSIAAAAAATTTTATIAPNSSAILQHHANVLTPTTGKVQRHLQTKPDNFDNVIDNNAASNLLFQPPDMQSQAQPAAAARSALLTSCQLPPTWTGKWYQANKEPIRVTNTEISDKGLCRDQKGDKFLFEFNGRQSSGASSSPQAPCLMCLVINERHLNVLQYKESSCQPIPANYYNRSATSSSFMDDDHSVLDSVCSDITGDAQLESLFRLDTPAIECPISGQYSFTYDNCREMQSSLDSCIDKKQLSFKFSACPDVSGSESKSETLKCYADWSEGNNYYMIGRLEDPSNKLDKGKFRCFVYEKSIDGKFIPMSQSLEESCNGLITAYEGPKILRLSPKPTIQHNCHFPSFIRSQSENWLSVDNSLIYMFNQNSTKYQVKETKEGTVIEEGACLQQFTAPIPNQLPLSQAIQPQQMNSQQYYDQQPHRGGNNLQRQHQANLNRRYQPAMSASYLENDQQQNSHHSDTVYLVQIAKNWFHKRSNGIVQIDYFKTSPNSDNICRNAYNEVPKTQVITSTNLESQPCPLEGVYTIETSPESDLSYTPSNIFLCPRQSFLAAQCDNPTRLRIHSKCTPTLAKSVVKNLHCLGSWTANGMVRLLLADDERQRYSAWYRDPYGALGMVAQDGATNTMLSLATTANQQQQPQPINALPSAAPIVDLQIALMTPSPSASKIMQVRLTRRYQCADLRGQASAATGVGNAGMAPYISNSIASYASATASASSAPHAAAWWPSLYLTVAAAVFGLTVLQADRRSTLATVASRH